MRLRRSSRSGATTLHGAPWSWYSNAPAFRLHVTHGRHEPPRPATRRRVARELRKVVAPVPERLDDHLPVRDLDRLDHQLAGEDAPPRNGDGDPAGGEERPVTGLQPADGDVADDETSIAQARGERSNRERPLQIARALAFGQLPQPRTDVDAEQRDDDDRHDDGHDRQDGAEEAAGARPAWPRGHRRSHAGRGLDRRRLSRSRAGVRGARSCAGLFEMHGHVSVASAGRASGDCIPGLEVSEAGIHLR